MRRRFISWLAIVLLLLLAVFFGGVVTGAVIPLFGSIRAERIGATAFNVAAIAETILAVTEAIVEWASRRKPDHCTAFPGPKGYGNKKHHDTDAQA